MAAKSGKSKKPSDTKEPREPPDLPSLFVDRSLDGEKLVGALRHAGVTVMRHRDLFGPETPDEQWLQRVGREKWIALTRDFRIRFRESEWAAVVKHDVRLLTLKARGPLTGTEMASIVAEALPAIKKFLADNAAPFVAKITRNGQVLLERRFSNPD